MKRVYRTAAVVASAIAVAAVLACLAGVVANNRKVTSPDAVAVSGAMSRGIVWIQRNRATIIEDNNPPLWWMLSVADEDLARTSPVADAVQAYRERWATPSRRLGVWQPMFEAGTPLPLDAGMIALGLPDYNRRFQVRSATGLNQ